ncbi:AAA family ATPase [Idiomarina aminovorans]|uniref:AAA family ATPase n=1 Tax=Idiomarina aminovorans TaxID=2914829 RepID=UPI002002E27A|nr:AAA family ATPase [Idiomarina sp. ATCH4]MCK7460021.1 AAA family ATPase [Idiomarina sp. ATCH4]
MKQRTNIQLTASSPDLPKLPLKLEKSNVELFEVKWLPLTFFWLARSLTLITTHDNRRDLAARLSQIAKLYELPDNLLENIVAFSHDNTDWRTRTPEVLGVRALQHRLNLSEDEYRCVAFSYLCCNSRLLEVMLNSVYRYFEEFDDILLLGKIIGVDVVTIERVIKENPRLGKMKITQSPEQYDDQMFRMSKEISERIHQCQSLNDNILAGVLHFVDPAKVRLDQFSYLKDELTLLKHCVEQTSSGACPPTQVLFIGRPGTGKTELVKALAEYADIGLVEVPVTKPDHNRDTSTYRLTEFERISLMLQGADNYQILFDEVEDVLRHGLLDEVRKAWINQLLEQRHVTSYWICNSTRDFEPSFLRRFDYVINMPEPDYYSRIALLEEALPNMGGKHEVIKSLAYADDLTPAMISQLSLLTERFSCPQIPAEKIIKMTQPQLPKVNSPELGDFNLTNTPVESPISKVKLEQLCSDGEDVKLLINGVSGSGKTALARYLCHQCNGSILFYSASTIIDHWADAFEYKLLDMFTRSVETKQLLVIDNIDYVLTAISRIMPSPHNTLQMLADCIKSSDAPVILTLGSAPNLAEYPMIENAVDYSVEMKLWDALKIRKHVDEWAKANGFNTPLIEDHCTATAQQVIQAIRKCKFEENIDCFQISYSTIHTKQLLKHVC